MIFSIYTKKTDVKQFETIWL